MEQFEMIEECHIVDHPIKLIAKTNKVQFNNLHSRFWIEQGRLQSEFAFYIRVKWLSNSNQNLKTFQIIDYNNWTNFNLW